MPRGEGKRRTSTWDRRLQKADDQKIKQRTRIEALFSLRNIPPTKQCPITCGRPTQMTPAQFERMCQHNQDLLAARVAVRCPGQPGELVCGLPGQPAAQGAAAGERAHLRDRRERELKKKEKAHTGATVQAFNWPGTEFSSQQQQGDNR